MPDKSPLPSPIPKRLAEARRPMKLSQKQLGVLAGIDELSASARVNQYETGKHSPDFGTVARLAKVLGVPSAYFYAEEDDLAELIHLFGHLSKMERRRLIETLRQRTPAADT